jgi:hypothetical protein
MVQSRMDCAAKKFTVLCRPPSFDFGATSYGAKSLIHTGPCPV